MYGHMTDWGWLWLSFMVVYWPVALGAVIYIAVKLANRDSKARSRQQAATGSDGRVAPR
jgi:hypothetical protein